jgi:hypothetical protein
MTNTQALSSIALTEGWTFKQADDTAENAWLSVKKVPTNVHLDLIEHGKCVQADLWRHQATHYFSRAQLGQESIRQVFTLI